MAGKGGGSWKVAYADFVTAMMAFFLVMWLSAQKQEVKEAVASYFRDPFAVESDKPSGGSGGGLLLDRGGLGTRKSSQKEKSGGPGVSNGPRIHVPDQLSARALGMLIEFPGATAELNESAKDQLRRLLPEILGKPQKIEIRGYTTRRPLPTESNYASPWRLCYARCVAAMEYLVEQGVESNRIRLSQAGIYGSRTREGLEGQQDKSGVEIFLLPELAEPPPGVVSESKMPGGTRYAAERQAEDAKGEHRRSPRLDAHGREPPNRGSVIGTKS
jgi:chemotaxis protein MotB